MIAFDGGSKIAEALGVKNGLSVKLHARVGELVTVTTERFATAEEVDRLSKAITTTGEFLLVPRSGLLDRGDLDAIEVGANALEVAAGRMLGDDAEKAMEYSRTLRAIFDRYRRKDEHD